MSLTTLLIAIAMAGGLLGTVLPIVPGLTLIWVAALAYGLLEGWGSVGIVCFAVITIVGLAGFAIAVSLPASKATTAGAGKLSVALGVGAAIVGFFALPPIGFAVLGVAGLYAGERLSGRDHPGSMEATVATLKGLGWAFVAEFVAGVVMIATWLVWVLFG